LQTVRDQFIQDGKLVEETVWFDDLPVAVLKPKGASATSPVSGTGNVATNNQDANNTGTNGNTAPPAAPTAKVNVEVFYVHPDHLGTPRVITASTALAATTGTGITSPQTVNKAVWRWDSDPFGSNATANSAPNENPNTLSQVVGTATLPYLFGFDLAFPGQKRDRETGKHYNYFRDYDPAVGRYFESDPIGLWGDASAFSYVGADPLGYIDMYGEQRARPGLPRYRKPPKPEKPKFSDPPPGPNDRGNHHEAANDMFRSDKDDQWFYCLAWHCPTTDQCLPSNYRGPNDWIPPATDPTMPPPGCICTKRVLLPSGPRPPKFDFEDPKGWPWPPRRKAL